MRYLVFLICLCCGIHCLGQHAGGAATGTRLAYVNMDTLEAKYELLKITRAKFITRKEEMESELQRAYQQMQADADDVQKKAQNNTLSQPEYEAAQKRILKKQQDLEARKQELTDQLTTEQETVNNNMRARLDEFLQQFNKIHHYDCILSYSWSGSSVLFVDKRLDITTQVVNGMNDLAEKEIQENK